jgi:DNA-binding transcriptional MerR regulator
MQELLSIGAFATIAGISIPTLRHYDDIGLFKPAVVDPDTSYRYYRRDQLRTARLIRTLRKVELTLATIREIVERDDPEFTRTVLVEHEAELANLRCTLGQLIERGGPMAVTGRVVQVRIRAENVAELAAFYSTVFGAVFDERISSLQFGTYPSDEFFLVTLVEPGEDAGPDGASRFGLLVDDLDARHAAALEAGATEEYGPVELPWKPRCSAVVDASGNHVDLYQA